LAYDFFMIKDTGECIFYYLYSSGAMIICQITIGQIHNLSNDFVEEFLIFQAAFFDEFTICQITK